MHFIYEPDKVIIAQPEHFELEKIFECGQCFRFERKPDGSYFGVAYQKALKLKEETDAFGARQIVIKTNKEDFEALWYDYFDLSTDYSCLCSNVLTDETMQNAVDCAKGIRILKQEPWECLISFIVSQNNNIPRIKKTVAALCERYGDEFTYNNETLYSFPSATQLAGATLNELKLLGLGYRDSYIIDAVNKVLSGETDLEKLKTAPTEVARTELMKIKGVGGKVADCILLFGFGRNEVCPRDVWVKRIFSTYYSIENPTEKNVYEFVSKKWGDYAGIAQQYLFYYERQRTKK